MVYWNWPAERWSCSRQFCRRKISILSC